MDFACNGEHPSAARTRVLESIRALSDRHPSIVGLLAPRIVSALDNAASGDVYVNAIFMSLTLDWRIDEAAEAIERAFSQDLIDCGFAGNWEQIRE